MYQFYMVQQIGKLSFTKETCVSFWHKRIYFILVKTKQENFMDLLVGLVFFG
jgi:hypothetical protein